MKKEGEYMDKIYLTKLSRKLDRIAELYQESKNTKYLEEWYKLLNYLKEADDI